MRYLFLLLFFVTSDLYSAQEKKGMPTIPMVMAEYDTITPQDWVTKYFRLLQDPADRHEMYEVLKAISYSVRQASLLLDEVRASMSDTSDLQQLAIKTTQAIKFNIAVSNKNNQRLLLASIMLLKAVIHVPDELKAMHFGSYPELKKGIQLLKVVLYNAQASIVECLVEIIKIQENKETKF